MELPRTANITALFREAAGHRHLDDTIDGLHWYSDQQSLLRELDSGDTVRAAAVVAVLSPRMPWHVNVRLARQAYQMVDLYRRGAIRSEHLRLPCLGHCSEKAFAILLTPGRDYDEFVVGPKVRSFWSTLVNPDDPRSVVVDRHAIDVAVGRVLGNRERDLYVRRPEDYELFASCYRRAAAILRRTYYPGPDALRRGRALLTPGEVQAVCWTYWRRTRANSFYGR